MHSRMRSEKRVKNTDLLRNPSDGGLSHALKARLMHNARTEFL